MTKEKYIHYTGILFILAGVVLRLIFPETILPLIMIIIGGTTKLAYIVVEIITKVYRPGKELLLLILGLTVFFSGIYLKHQAFELAWLIMGTGLLMKISFLVLFSQKKKKDALIAQKS